MVSFRDAKPDKKNYRRFKIKTVAGKTILPQMNEVVQGVDRRADGRKNSAARSRHSRRGTGGSWRGKSCPLNTLGLQIPLIGLAKEQEEIYLPDNPEPKQFDKNRPE